MCCSIYFGDQFAVKQVGSFAYILVIKISFYDFYLYFCECKLKLKPFETKIKYIPMKLRSNLIKGVVYAFLGSLAVGISANASNYVSIIKKDGTIKQFEIQEDGKLFFEGNDMVVSESASVAENKIDLAEIEKVLFNKKSDAGTGLADDLTTESISVFPNPTTDLVYISDTQDGSKVEIISWNGMLLNVQNYSVGRGVSLKEYPTGLYTLRVDGRTFKIYKK